MADDTRNAALTRALSDAVADLADLLQKEVALARAEIAAKLSNKLRAGAWIAAAAGLGFMAAFLIAQAAVFGIAAATGLALHWACLIVAGLLGAAAFAAYAVAKAGAEEDVTPHRTIRQMKQDIAAAKEQFT
jgi:putative superfamily III holin-X